MHHDEPLELQIGHRSVQWKCNVCGVEVHGFRVVSKCDSEFSCLEGSISLTEDYFQDANRRNDKSGITYLFFLKLGS